MLIMTTIIPSRAARILMTSTRPRLGGKGTVFFQSIGYGYRTIGNFGRGGEPHIGMQYGQLYDVDGDESAHWSERWLYDADGDESVGWQSRWLIDSDGVQSADWDKRWLYDSDGIQSADWDERWLYDSDGIQSADWHARYLFASDGTTVVLNWSSRAGHISDPTGGATNDAEARTAIGLIIDALEGYGLLATS